MRAWQSSVVYGAGFALALASVFVAACASNDDADITPEDTQTPVPTPDAGGVDGADEETCTGDDCDFFLDACEPGALCPSGLFGDKPTSGVDWRARVEAIRGRSATNAWLVGTMGLTGHFDGSAWRSIDVGGVDSLFYLWLADRGELAFGWLDRVFTRGLGASDAGVSADGWTDRGELTPPTGASSRVTAAWGRTGSSTMWVGTEAEVWRIQTDGATLTTSPGVPQSVCQSVPCKFLRAFDGTSANVVWGVGENGAAIRITSAETETPKVEVMNPLTWSTLSGVWAVSDTEAWAVGARGLVIHNVGATFGWNVVEVPTTEHLRAVSGSSPSDIWVVGDKGVVLHYDGATWTRIKLAGMVGRRPELLSVWVPEPGKVWVGGQGVLLSLGGKQ